MVTVILPLIVLSISAIAIDRYLYYMGHREEGMGSYFERYGVIILRTLDRTPQQIEITTIHEIGHKIYSEYLNDSQRQEFEDISLKYRQNESFYCINGYDNTTKEDFADSYRQYNLHNYFAFDECQDKLTFFKVIDRQLFEQEGIVIG